MICCKEIAPSLFSLGRPMLEKILEKIIEGFGEGIICRKYKSSYVHGRSDMLLKFKVNKWNNWNNCFFI